MQCKQCKNEIEKYCDFPGTLCLNCHEKNFDPRTLTAENIANAFKKAITVK